MAIKPDFVSKTEKKKNNQNDLSHLASDIIANAGVGIYIVQHGKFVFVSELYQKITGYEDTELLSTYSLNNIYPDDREMVREEAIKCLKGKSFKPYEFRFVKKNAEIMWVLETITPIVYKEERGTLGSFMDITERKQAEAALQKSEEQYRTLVKNASDIVYRTDHTGRFTFANPAMISITGYSEEEIIGKHYKMLVRPDKYKEAMK
ncbi:MAG: PAS domain-containing protein, partial [Smithella sp.]